MTEFISRNYGNEGYEVIIKTDSHECYEAAVKFARRMVDHKNLGEDIYVPGKWISVEDIMPDTRRNDDGCVCSKVLVFREEKTVHMGYCVMQIVLVGEEPMVMAKWYDQSGHRWEDVTHWMPLPEPPKEE